MKMSHFCSIAAAAVTAAAFAGPASAIGCNGIVNPQVAGCARSDNNDGPTFPYYRPQRVTLPANTARIEMKQGTPMVQYQGKWLPVTSAAGGSVIAATDGL
ncbi:MAG TPA: hypothetical protein VGD66_08590 [Allosphingosinicella sp.]|jgi:hypothetical protein